MIEPKLQQLLQFAELTKVIRYALVHDLLEAYTGTFPAYSRTDSNQNEKEKAEVYALQRIKEELRHFPELIIDLDNFMMHRDNESLFIYALDKFLPLLNIELNNNPYYFENEVTYEEMLRVKEGKIASDPTVLKYFRIFAKYLREERQFFWPENQGRDYSQKEYSF